MKNKPEDILKTLKTNFDDPFYIGYNMLKEGLKHKHIINGFPSSLTLAQIYLNSDEIIIYRRSNNKDYTLFSQSHVSNNIDFSKQINELIKQEIINDINYYKEYNFDDGEIKNLSIIPFDWGKRVYYCNS